MMNDKKYIFPKEERIAYERLLVPLAVYQFVDNKVVTLLVSDGLCELTGTTRSQLTEHYDHNMFEKVHPDDVEALAQIGYRFALEEDLYDVIYRTKLHGKGDEYRTLHTVGKFQTVGGGARVAFLYYTDLTDSGHSISQLALEINDPKVTFFDQNLGPLAVVSKSDHRLLYYNRALCRLIPPRVSYDSGMTFGQFFYPDYPEDEKGYFDAVDGGPIIIEEPYTKRPVEVNVISSNWNGESAYVIHFYDAPADPQAAMSDSELRHKRTVFNKIMFSETQKGHVLSERGYRGFRVWNLSRNESILCQEKNGFSDKCADCISLDLFFDSFRSQCRESEELEFLELCTRSSLLQLYHSGSYPRGRSLTLRTPKGKIYVALELTMMKSPDNGDIYIKVSEENITDEEIIRTLIATTVKQEYDYIAYLDVLADQCWRINGKSEDQIKGDQCISIKDYFQSAPLLENLAEVLGIEFESIEQIEEYFLQHCREDLTFSVVHQLADGRVKNIFIQILDRQNQIYYFRCTDVTALLNTEKEREKELIAAKNEVLKANRKLQRAVLAEREKVESVLVQTILSVSNALDARDPYTCRHSERVAKYAAEIARRLSWSEPRVKNLYNIALVHDIGKIGIPDALLMKTSALTQEEYETVKKHVEIGGTILKDFTAINKVTEGALYHHERYDGSGYGIGLKGDEIPIEARIIGIADAVDAMNSTRPYRERQNQEYIIAELERGRATQFDPALVYIMLSLIKAGILEADTEAPDLYPGA